MNPGCGPDAPTDTGKQHADLTVAHAAVPFTTIAKLPLSVKELAISVSQQLLGLLFPAAAAEAFGTRAQFRNGHGTCVDCLGGPLR
eukprot:scaffold306_cov525-Prasinococcus_capsulatus_cf.AAC.43